MLSNQRSTEDRDLLERSTKKPKRTADAAEIHALGSGEAGQTHADVEVVSETPSDEMVTKVTSAHAEDQGDREMDTQVGMRASSQAPIQSRRTYAQSLAGTTVHLLPSQVADHDLSSAESTDDEEMLDDEGDDPLCPTIRLTKREIEAIRAPWRKTLIVKVLGRTVGYAYLLRRLISMWKPKGSLDLIAIDNGYFLVRFGSVDDLEFAMFEGPWMVLDHYLIVKEWEPDFDPFAAHTEKVLVWIRIPCLPAEYYNIIFLRKLGNKVGRSVRVDQATSLVSRGMFARICVEIDITKPMISKFTYNGRVRYVSYEGLHMVCFTCGLYGHSEETCPKRAQATQDPKENQAEATREHRPQAETGIAKQSAVVRPDAVGSAPFGVWMIAPGRKGGRPPGSRPAQHQAPAAGGDKRKGGEQVSRFAPLRHDPNNEGINAEIADEGPADEDGVGISQIPAELKNSAPVRVSGGGRQRRPNVIATEKQIENEVGRSARAGAVDIAQSSSLPRRNPNTHSRRAAEEEEHVVVRGEKGGLIISSTRVCMGDMVGDIPSPVWQATNEHHSDPLAKRDDEGDVVMNLESSQAQREIGEHNGGAGGKPFRRALLHLLKTHKPCILGLFEPKVSGSQANKICSNLGFSDWIRIEAVGFSGGIWVFWKDVFKVTVSFTHPQFILLQVSQPGQDPWNLAAVYASPAHHLRRRLWTDLTHASRGIQGPWLVAGDFNTVVSREETKNYVSFSAQRSSEFVNWINDEGLVDLGFSGPKLTWVKDGSTTTIKGARLDRAMCNLEWRARFPDAAVSHLARLASDHAPILLKLDGGRSRNYSNMSPFLFQAAWLRHPDLQEVVHDTWNGGLDLRSNLHGLASTLSGWNRTVFGNIHFRKNSLLARIGGVQRMLATRQHRGLFKLEYKLRRELEEILYQEELLWYQ
ncbi:PREDICTED: uncharacterized protein LOC109150389 [Ipomoea nil]|uniref:uncharacterized protein LOC109150389 n=1 Tax=Ipomoea nil TaxID=35883 RepID=UPI000901DECD|nr:PREDICTED: uncharacterized protein LOC109150389 [Ipomoea nil]